MITFDYKKVAVDLYLKKGYKRKDVEAVQLAAFAKVKEGMAMTNINQEEASAVRIRFFGIFRPSFSRIHLFKKRNDELI